MKCPRCRVLHLVVIDLELKGEKLRMHSCSSCGTKWWENSGEPIGLDEVLELATVHR